MKVRIADAHIRLNGGTPTNRELHQRHPVLQDLIASTAAYVGPGVGLDDLRANNAANVYLSICLGLQAAGVLSIQHVPALWIDIGDQAYKVSRYVKYKGIPPLAHRGMQICFPVPGDASESSQDQPLDLNYTQSEQRRENFKAASVQRSEMHAPSKGIQAQSTHGRVPHGC